MTNPSPTPTYILRGHTHPIHALRFFRQNTRLISADADGYLVVWATDSKRAVASWRAHGGAILGIGVWGERVISHGRDHRLRVWQYRKGDEEEFSKRLPVDISAGVGEANGLNGKDGAGRDPWLLHSLEVSALNFCAFAMCEDIGAAPVTTLKEEIPDADPDISSSTISKEGVEEPNPILVALPNTLNTGGIDIFDLPSERRLSTIPAHSSITTGMVMALAITFTSTQTLTIASGYESGHTFVHGCQAPSSSTKDSSCAWKWHLLYNAKSHTQPVLSLSISPPPSYRSPSSSGKGAAEEPYYVTSSADSLLIKHPLTSPSSTTSPLPSLTPLKIQNTHHASQQSLTIRSDGKLLATAGWDGRARIYSCKSLAEKAVLRWHKEGVYACAFAKVRGEDGLVSSGAKATPEGSGDGGRTVGQEIDMSVAVRGAGALEQMKMDRREKARNTHWVAVGGKDGKVSLWDVF